MSITEYIVGLVVLTAILLPLGLAARSLRTWLFDGWSGALARLAECIILLALLYGIAHILGTVGQFRRWPFVTAAVVVGLALHFVACRRAPAPDVRLRSERPQVPGPSGRPSLFRTLGIVALLCIVAVPWLGRTFIVLRTGIWDYDSLSYYLPFAARFVQQGSITPLHLNPIGYESAFYPKGYELLHAIGMLAFQRDILSPLLNLFWLSVALLAAWCVGAARKVAPATLAALVVLLTTPLFVGAEAGQVKSDVADTALLLAAVAFLLHGMPRSNPVKLAGAAAGLALASKLSMALPVAALTVGVIVVAGRGQRVRIARDWFPWLLITGSFWFARNLVVFGNPIPFRQLSIGPFSLPATRARPTLVWASVTDYLTTRSAWSSTFLPGLHQSLGWVWPVILVMALTGFGLGLLHRHSLLRSFGAVGVVAFVGYLTVPGGAAGFVGEPFLFAYNLRWVFGALALGLTLFALIVASRWRTGRWLLPALLGGIGLVNQIHYVSKMRPSVALVMPLGVALAALALAGMTYVVRSPAVSRALVTGAAVVALVAGVAIGWRVQRSYYARRWTEVDTSRVSRGVPANQFKAVYAWAREVSGARIAVAGIDMRYPLYGPDLSNFVQFLGKEGARGTYNRARDCAEWRMLVNDGRYDYVVTAAGSILGQEPIQATWTRTDPAVSVVMQKGSASVFRVERALSPSACSGRA